MSENRQIQNSTTTRRNIRVLEKYSTSNATPVVVYSVPLGPGRASFIQAKAIAVQSDFSHMQAIDIQAGFRRATGGNVTRATTGTNKGFEISNGDFAGPKPTINLIANTVNQTIDIQVEGKAATAINWYIELLSIQNID